MIRRERPPAPGPLRWIGYAYGAKLPARYREWVRMDLTGDHATRRHLLRAFAALSPFYLSIYLVLLLAPGENWVRLLAVALAIILGVFYNFAYMVPNRGRRLVKHDLPANLQNPKRSQHQADRAAAYQRNHPDSRTRLDSHGPADGLA